VLALAGPAVLAVALGGSLTAAALVGPGRGDAPEPRSPTAEAWAPAASAAVAPRADEGAATPARTDVPVLLVPGWLDTARDLAALRIRFMAAGWTHVETLTFRDPAGSNRDHALEIDSAVTRMLAETGAERVDIVAHSMGGLATRWYLLTHHPAPVRRTAFLGSPHHGTLAAHLAWGAGGDEMTPGSDFLETLNGAPPVPEGVEAITVRTPIDTRVVPGESATLPGVEDRSVCCPSHPGLVEPRGGVRVSWLDFLERPEPAGSHP
jgi:triacylglycerol lipase